MSHAHNSSMPRFLRVAVAAKAKGKRWPQVLDIAKRAGFDGVPVRLRLMMQAYIIRAALEEYLAGRPPDAIYRAAQAAGFQGRLPDVWFLIQRATDWPRVLWADPAVGTPWRARKQAGRAPTTGKSNPRKYLFQVRRKGRQGWVSMVERS